MPMEISVTLAGKTITLTCDDIFIHDVKLMIQDKLGIAEDEQVLVFGAAQLEDNNFLSDYNIQPQSMMHLVYAASRSIASTRTSASGCIFYPRPADNKAGLAAVEEPDAEPEDPHFEEYSGGWLY